jgi:hypothetical protein
MYFLSFLRFTLIIHTVDCASIDFFKSGKYNATYESERAAEEFQDALNHVIENDMKQKLASARAISLMCFESDVMFPFREKVGHIC